MWLPKLLWEQVAVPLWKGPPTLTYELMELVAREEQRKSKENAMKKIVAMVMFMVLLGGAASKAESPAAAAAQVFHVTSTHKATPNEKSYKTAFNELYIEGTIGNKKYTLSMLDTWGSYHYEVGQDYQVVQIKSGSPDTIKLMIPNKYDKNGKKPFRTDTLTVQTVEEKPAPIN